MLGLDIAYIMQNLTTLALVVPMVGAHKNFNGSCDLPCPFQGWFTICGLALATMSDIPNKSIGYLHPSRR